MPDPRYPIMSAANRPGHTPPTRSLRIVGALALPLMIVWCTDATWIALRYIRDLEIAASMAYIISVGLGGKAPDAPFDPGVTVVTRLSWLAMMWLVGLWTTLAAVWALRGKPAATWMFRAAGFAILLTTAATFAGIEILIHWGGFPPLPGYTIALICGCQSILGLIFLIVTRKRPRPTSAP